VPVEGRPSLRTRLCQEPFKDFKSVETVASKSEDDPSLLSIRCRTTLLLTRVP
jgi:hypothetical protein